MIRLHFIATCFAIITLGTAVAAAEPRASAGNGDLAEVTDLHPFTHTAYIPMGSRLSSIRIEAIKLVKVATKRRTVTSERYCAQPWTEPGGSMFCERTTDESSVPAYRVTYSYSGQLMASDEQGNAYFTFSVYFRPDEISPQLREVVALGKIQRAALAEFFTIATSSELVQHMAIDQANSTRCDGNYFDGDWVRTNPKCEDNIAYRKVAIPSSYITVKVDPRASRLETESAASGPWSK